ncbi:MAG: neutral/alkaline non-lysosomal ceramidase N-terminal domain-containing protein [Coriobacteriaceae bacterium]|nr:neutral/alkaline non-lysosomal ceramidase N-terminal domain-containing protein [Coriobacteriaceae bacterium]
MKAANISVDITPKGTFWMEGYIHPIRKQPATGVHDIPLATLLLLEIEGVRELFVSIDVCMLKAQLTDRMRTGLSDLLGIAQDHIVINAIHSHSCPSGFEGTSPMGIPITPGYNDMVTGLVVQAATKLTDKLVEAAPQLLIQRVHGWYSNRNDASAPFDDEALILRFVDADGVVAGAMLNFNCHATVVGPTNRLLTTDVQGGVRNELAEWIGCVPYIFTGASGDLGNRQFRRGSDFAELRRVSNGIAGEIMKGVFIPIELSTPIVHSFSHHVTYNNEQFYPQYKKQLDAVHRVLVNNPTLDEKKLADTEKEMLEQQLARHEVDFTVQMITIDFGKLVFVTFPGELASELGACVKEPFTKAGKHPAVIGYANDYQGYFVAAHTYGTASYESYVTKMPKGWTEEMLAAYREQL